MKVAPKSAAENAAYRIANAPEAATAYGGGYENNLHTNLAEQSRHAYLSDYILLQQIQQARADGILEVTLRTRTGAVSVPLDYKAGFQMACEAIEVICNKLNEIENDIATYTKTGLEEDRGDPEGESDRARVFAFCLPMRRLSDAEFNALPPEARRAYESYGAAPRFTDAELAQQVATSNAPQQPTQ